MYTLCVCVCVKIANNAVDSVEDRVRVDAVADEIVRF